MHPRRSRAQVIVYLLSTSWFSLWKVIPIPTRLPSSSIDAINLITHHSDMGSRRQSVGSRADELKPFHLLSPPFDTVANRNPS